MELYDYAALERTVEAAFFIGAALAMEHNDDAITAINHQAKPGWWQWAITHPQEVAEERRSQSNTAFSMWWRHTDFDDLIFSRPPRVLVLLVDSLLEHPWRYDPSLVQYHLKPPSTSIVSDELMVVTACAVATLFGMTLGLLRPDQAISMLRKWVSEPGLRDRSAQASRYGSMEQVFDEARRMYEEWLKPPETRSETRPALSSPPPEGRTSGPRTLEDRTVKHVLTREDLQRLLEAAQASKNRVQDEAMIRLAIETGARAADIGRMLVADAELDFPPAPLIPDYEETSGCPQRRYGPPYFYTPNRKKVWSSQKITEQAHAVLLRLVNSQGLRPIGPLFMIRRGAKKGQPIGTAGFHRVLERLGRSAGVGGTEGRKLPTGNDIRRAVIRLDAEDMVKTGYHGDSVWRTLQDHFGVFGVEDEAYVITREVWDRLVDPAKPWEEQRGY